LRQVDRAVEEPLGWEDFGRYNGSGARLRCLQLRIPPTSEYRRR
jgi:hypothetical protein